MDLRQLEMFQAIVETGSFTRAGEKLYVSQSAISRQIKLLEDELGDQIFKRINKKIYLTPAGEVLLQHSRRIFNEVRLMVSAIADMTQTPRGTLRMAGGMSVCTYLFPRLLKEYQSRYPDIEVTIATGTNDEILRLLRANQTDLALLSLPCLDDDLEVQPALSEEMVLVTECDHPLARKKEVRFQDLIPYTFIHFERGSNTRKLIDEIFHEESVHFANTMELQNVEITKPLVEIGLGISIIPYPAVVRDSKSSLCYRRIEGRRIYRELGWVYLKSDYVPRPMKHLLTLFDEMKQQFTSAEKSVSRAAE
ncbi:MAG: LysR family transcriptional regulator [Acidobacteria bacterium]|nr:LysR family transcriptional regulator [Acidobacteriota bacterium]